MTLTNFPASPFCRKTLNFVIFKVNIHGLFTVYTTTTCWRREYQVVTDIVAPRPPVVSTVAMASSGSLSGFPASNVADAVKDSADVLC